MAVYGQDYVVMNHSYNMTTASSVCHVEPYFLRETLQLYLGLGKILPNLNSRTLRHLGSYLDIRVACDIGYVSESALQVWYKGE